VVLICCCETLVGFDPNLESNVREKLRQESEGRTEFLKFALCLVMHSLYKSADQGANLRVDFDTRSRISLGATSPVMFRYRSRDVGAVIFRKPEVC